MCVCVHHGRVRDQREDKVGLGSEETYVEKRRVETSLLRRENGMVKRVGNEEGRRQGGIYGSE